MGNLCIATRIGCDVYKSGFIKGLVSVLRTLYGATLRVCIGLIGVMTSLGAVKQAGQNLIKTDTLFNKVHIHFINNYVNQMCDLLFPFVVIVRTVDEDNITDT